MLGLTRDEFELGVIMRDAPAMMRFYGEVLGLPLESSFPIPGIGIRHKFRYGANSIKLIELDRVPEAAAAPGLPWDATGVRYWTAHVSDLAGLLDHLAETGAAVLLDVQQVTPTISYAIVADPDGNGIELVQGA